MSGKSKKRSRRGAKGDGTIIWVESKKRYMVQLMKTGVRKTAYATSWDEALKKLRELQFHAKNNTKVTSESKTLGIYLEEWLQSGKMQWEEKTHADYASLMRIHIIPRLGQIKLAKLTTETIEKEWAKMADDGVTKSVIAHCHSRLSTALTRAVQLSLIPRNPINGVRKPKVVEREIHFLSEAEQMRIFRPEILKDYYSVSLTSLRTGLRRGELAALRWRDIDLGERKLHVKHSLKVRAGGEVIWGETKTKTSRRTVPLDSPLVDHLYAEFEKQVDNGERLGYEVTRNSSVFVRENGNMLLPRAIYGGFKRNVTQLGLDDVRFHDLRHTHASMLIEMNENPKIIQELLGHDDIRTTLNTYGHLMEGLGRETKDRFGSRFPITR